MEAKLRARAANPDAATEAAAAARELTVSFNADCNDGMPWRFLPSQPNVKARTSAPPPSHGAEGEGGGTGVPFLPVATGPLGVSHTSWGAPACCLSNAAPAAARISGPRAGRRLVRLKDLHALPSQDSLQERQSGPGAPESSYAAMWAGMVLHVSGWRCRCGRGRARWRSTRQRT